MKEGRKEGRKEWRKQWRKEGRKGGRKRERKAGRKDGREEGRKEGRKEGGKKRQPRNSNGQRVLLTITGPGPSFSKLKFRNGSGPEAFTPFSAKGTMSYRMEEGISIHPWGAGAL